MVLHNDASTPAECGQALNQLQAMKAFVRVVEAGSFARAADQLGLPRSTVSKLILDLEQHLSVKLVQRTTRRMTVTAAGLDYHERAQEIVAAVEAADAAVGGDAGRPHGLLRVDVPASFARAVLLPALPDFNKRYPDVTLALGISDRTVNIVGEGSDVAIRSGELQNPTLIAKKLFDMPFVTCASADYLSRHGTPSTPEDLRTNHRLVGYFSAATDRPVPFVFDSETGREEVFANGFSANDGEGQIALIRAGFGVGQTLRRYVQPLIDTGEIQPVLEDVTKRSNPFHILYASRRHRTAREKAFVDWASRALAKGGGDPEAAPADPSAGRN